DCYELLESVLNRLIALGPPPIRIRMDEPLSHTHQLAVDLQRSDLTPQLALDQTNDFIRRVRQHFDVSITSLEAYPYNSAALLSWWMAGIVAGAQANGVRPPDSFELDHDKNRT